MDYIAENQITDLEVRLELIIGKLRRAKTKVINIKDNDDPS